MKKILKDFIYDEAGFEVGEKSILLVLAAIAALGAGSFLIPKVKAAFTSTGTNIDNAAAFTY